MEHKLACSAVSLTKVGETESPTMNCTVTFQLCQIQLRSQGPLLSIPAEQETGRKGPCERGCVRQRIEFRRLCLAGHCHCELPAFKLVL